MTTHSSILAMDRGVWWATVYGGPVFLGVGGVQTGRVNVEKAPGEDIPGGTVDKNPPLKARDMV